MSQNRVYRFVGTAMLAAGLAWPLAEATAQQTGSRLKGAPSQPITTIRLDEPSEIRAIRQLLTDGKVEEAERTAKALLTQSGEPSIQYFGQNALCAVYNSAKKWDAALETCGKAIDLRPGYWMAWNTRGATYLMTGRPDLALADFERARQLVPSTGQLAEIVEHNIALARGGRKAPDG